MRAIILYRVYEFSSAHRLDSPVLGESQNRSVYDKCNNFNGHGHDYYLEVGIKGVPDKKTGMVFDLSEMDLRVNGVIKELDYRHLNKQVSYFENTISSGENIIKYLWSELEKLFGSQVLTYLKLWETNNNYFELSEIL